MRKTVHRISICKLARSEVDKSTKGKNVDESLSDTNFLKKQPESLCSTTEEELKQKRYN